MNVSNKMMKFSESRLTYLYIHRLKARGSIREAHIEWYIMVDGVKKGLKVMYMLPGAFRSMGMKMKRCKRKPYEQIHGVDVAVLIYQRSECKECGKPEIQIRRVDLLTIGLGFLSKAYNWNT